MTKTLPAWEMKCYSTLWKRFKDREFTNIEAQKELEVDPHKVSVLFYNLKRKGWIDIKRSEEDKRKKVYKLISPENAVEELDFKNSKK